MIRALVLGLIAVSLIEAQSYGRLSGIILDASGASAPGAAILVVLINVVSSYTVHWQLILGAVYILIAFGFRRWLVGRLRPLWR